MTAFGRQLEESCHQPLPFRAVRTYPAAMQYVRQQVGYLMGYGFAQNSSP